MKDLLHVEKMVLGQKTELQFLLYYMSTKIITSEAHKLRDGKLDYYFIASIIFICNAVLDIFFLFNFHLLENTHSFPTVQRFD